MYNVSDQRMVRPFVATVDVSCSSTPGLGTLSSLKSSTVGDRVVMATLSQSVIVILTGIVEPILKLLFVPVALIGCMIALAVFLVVKPAVSLSVPALSSVTVT